MRIFSLLITLLFVQALSAQKTSYPAHKMSAKGVDEIRINGVKGTLLLKAKDSKVYTVKVKHTRGRKGEDWNLSVDRQGNAMVLEVFSTEYGREWRKQVRKDKWPEFDIELEGPSQPAVVAWREGTITVENWAAAVDTSFLSGPMTVKGMRGDLKVQAVNSVLRVSDHKGTLTLKGESGRVDLFDIQGKSEVHWVNGNLSLRRCTGGGDVDLTSGEIQAAETSGDWKVKLGEGRAEFNDVQGQFKGQGESSKWEVSAGKGTADLEVATKSGEVGIQWKEKAAVKVFLTSSKGEIQVPVSLKVEPREGVKVVEGVFNSSAKAKPGSNVFVRTESGKIIWR